MPKKMPRNSMRVTLAVSLGPRGKVMVDSCECECTLVPRVVPKHHDNLSQIAYAIREGWPLKQQDSTVQTPILHEDVASCIAFLSVLAEQELVRVLRTNAREYLMQSRPLPTSRVYSIERCGKETTFSVRLTYHAG